MRFIQINQQATNHKKWADRIADQGVALQRKDKVDFEKPLLKACLKGSKLWKPPKEDRPNTELLQHAMETFLKFLC